MPPARTYLIHTERLALRPYDPGDFDNMGSLMSDPRTWRLPPGEPMNAEDVWTRLLRHVGHWATFGFGFFAVEEAGTGRFVGEAGFSFFRRDMGANLASAPEATWTVAPERQGRGYAQEAALAAQGWIERQTDLPRTLCMIHPDNHASLRIAEKVGYREIRRSEYRGTPVLFFERRRGAPPAR